MKMGILAILLIYYSALVAFFAFATFDPAYSISGNPVDNSSLGSNETGTGGLFSIGITFARFFGFVAFGVFIPVVVPLWFAIFFVVWQSAITMYSAAFVISAIWDG